MLITILILVVTVAFFITGKFRTDFVALWALLALMLTGILTPREAFSGFSNTVIFVIAGMFIVSGSIVKTGLASILSNKILGVAGKNTNSLFMLVMLLAALIGSLVSNTGTVAIMMPIVVSMSRTIDESPGRFLMPLAYMSSIGGMFTLIGNSPNMVVSDALIKGGFAPLSLFSFFPVGVVCFLFGVLILAPTMSIYLSRRKNIKEAGKRGGSMLDLADKYHLAQNMYEITVPPASSLTGQSLTDLHLPEKFGVAIQEISRDEHIQGYFGTHYRKNQFSPRPDTTIRGGDTLQILGSREGVQKMVAECGLHLSGQTGVQGGGALRFASIGVCELVLMSSSRLIKRTVAEADLRKQFGITVLGIQRSDQYLIENIKDEIMHSGDSLLVQGSWEDLARLEKQDDMGWVVVGRPKDQAGKSGMRQKIPLVAAVLVLMLVGMAFSLLSTVVAVTLASLILIAGGCFKNMDEVYTSINWETIVLIACLMPMALAMEKTGIVDILSDRMVGLCANYGPHVALAVVYGVTSFMNILISTTPVALLVSPVAISIATSLGYSPLPFMFAVATAASMCFASPFSTPSNALVMSAGRYTFLDYMKIGLPMQIAMGMVMVFVLPWLFPFNP